MEVTIWHNTKCSTSQKVLALLQSNFQEITIRDYIAHAPSVEELKYVLMAMNLPVATIVRKKDKVYKASFEGKDLTDHQWLEALSNNPTMIERPIVQIGSQYYMGRPYEDFAARLNSSLIQS